MIGFVVFRSDSSFQSCIQLMCLAQALPELLNSLCYFHFSLVLPKLLNALLPQLFCYLYIVLFHLWTTFLDTRLFQISVLIKSCIILHHSSKMFQTFLEIPTVPCSNLLTSILIAPEVLDLPAILVCIETPFLSKSLVETWINQLQLEVYNSKNTRPTIAPGRERTTTNW